MFRHIALIALVLAATGCTRQSPVESAAGAQAQRGQTSLSALPISARSSARSFAQLPDRGELLGYVAGTQRVDGAYTWHRADISEAHALAAITSGMLTVRAPDGTLLHYAYDHHVEHDSGDWTWIGHLPGRPGEQSIITFGRDAVFGSLAQAGKLPLRLTVRQGVSWLVETDGAKVAALHNAATDPRKPDFMIPPARAARPAQLQPGASTSSTAVASATATAGTTTIDLVLGYTAGFVADNGGTTSSANTRLNFMVDVANVAYRNSQIVAQVRLVKTLAVNYTETTSNDSTLEQLTGYRSGTGPITPNAAFNALRAARDQYGADLVSLVRKFHDPEHDGCGIAWLIGGGQSGIGASDASFGYSVVSDGTDQGTDGKTYYCLDETLAHEMGHNEGSAHDRDTAAGDNGVLDADEYGAYPYSFGYKSSAGNFYTVMAYGDTGQRIYRAFSNPAITFCGGATCGIANTADNARSLRQTLPLVSTFRNTVVPATARINFLDLVAIQRNAGAATALRVASRDSDYQTQSFTATTTLPATGTDGSWAFAMGDQNGDGLLDLYAIKKMGASGRTEVYVLSGAAGYRAVLLQKATALGTTGSDQRWLFKLGDYNRDGKLDLYAIDRMATSGKTEVHILNGADGFASYLAHRVTGLQATGNTYAWRYELADYNRDGQMDLYAVYKLSGTGKTAVHVMDGASGFTRFFLRAATALGPTGSDNAWDFKVGDYDRDGFPDLYAIFKTASTGKTEVHIMNGASMFTTFLLHVATVLPVTGADSSWEFEVARAG